jgi:hypothetical protein
MFTPVNTGTSIMFSCNNYVTKVFSLDKLPGPSSDLLGIATIVREFVNNRLEPLVTFKFVALHATCSLTSCFLVS